MYYCERCSKLSKSGETQFNIVTETREKLYVNEVYRDRKKKVIHSKGREIVEEVKVCQLCYNDDRNLNLLKTLSESNESNAKKDNQTLGTLSSTY